LSIPGEWFPQLLSFELDTSTSDDLHDALSDNAAETYCTPVLLNSHIALAIMCISNTLLQQNMPILK